MLLFCLLVLAFGSQAQEKYKIVDQAGREVALGKIIAEVESKPLVFFGELHGQAEAHALELDLLTTMHQRYPGRVKLGMEMFEADVQPIVNEYYQGFIQEKSFETESRIWTNYIKDYKPLVSYAKSNKIPLLATNVPRRYANAVYHQGLKVLDSLNTYAKQYIAPLPLQVDTTLSIYAEMLQMMPDHKNANLVYAQGVKDATMAHFIEKNLQEHTIFLHVNGAYHSKRKEGIPTFFKQYPKEKILVIQTLKSADMTDELLKEADYSLIIESM